MAKEYYLYEFINPSISTVSGFINDETSLVQGMTKIEFLSYKVEGLTNSDRIWAKYNSIEQATNRIKYSTNNLDLLKQNTLLAIPLTNLNRELIPIIGKNQVVEQGNYTTFLADKLQALLEDPEYKPAVIDKLEGNGALVTSFPEISVWIWMRSLSNEKIILDITPYIQDLNISVAEDGGTFSFLLPPTTTNAIFYYNKGLLSENLLHKIKEKELSRNNFFFHQYISENDVVFIRFETLQNEVKDRFNHYKSVLYSDLPNKNYDMIGLVDRNSQSTNYANADVGISISGRDLIKLFYEDGCYFLYSTLSSTLDESQGTTDPLWKRLVSSEKYENMYVKGYRTISDSLKTLINIFSNIEVVPEEVFSFYGKNRSTTYRATDDENYEEELLQGIWQIVKLVIDKNVANRRIVDESFSQPEGSLMDLVPKIVQQPFAEILFDTYGDQYHLVARQPPFTQRAILNYIEQGLVIDIEEESVIRDDLGWNISNIYGWYRFLPQGILMASQDTTLQDLIPAVAFPEYIRIWGNKKLEVINNYYPSILLNSVNYEEDTDYRLEQAYEDYLYILETHLYLPFTRRGSVTINGDRRIKRGTFIRLKGTKEIYYVNGVSNSYSVNERSIERVTTLDLIRGMKEEYIKGKGVWGQYREDVENLGTNVSISQKRFSYFNIADLSVIKRYFSENISKPKGTLIKDFKLNPEVFQFFLERRQFND